MGKGISHNNKYVTLYFKFYPSIIMTCLKKKYVGHDREHFEEVKSGIDIWTSVNYEIINDREIKTATVLGLFSRPALSLFRFYGQSNATRKVSLTVVGFLYHGKINNRMKERRNKR